MTVAWAGAVWTSFHFLSGRYEEHGLRASIETALESMMLVERIFFTGR